MITIPIGKLRGLQKCTSSRGVFTALALDHRQNLRKALNPSNPSKVSDKDLTDFKLIITAALANDATAVLYDPEFSAAQAIISGAMPGNKGLVVAIESTGYSGDPAARKSRILPGWSLAKAKKMGADMVKLLVYFHPDSPTANEVITFVETIAKDSINLDIGLMIEPLSYSLDPNQKTLISKEKEYVVIESARRLIFPGVDILKAEFPIDPVENPEEEDWKKVCQALTNTSNIPWILLSAAIDFETYLRQVSIACIAGASGIAVGRAVWQEAVKLNGFPREEFLQTTARNRMQRLSALCTAHARPFTEIFSLPNITSDWYKSY